MMATDHIITKVQDCSKACIYKQAVNGSKHVWESKVYMSVGNTDTTRTSGIYHVQIANVKRILKTREKYVAANRETIQNNYTPDSAKV